MSEPGYKPGLTLATQMQTQTQIQTQEKTRVNFLNANANAKASADARNGKFLFSCACIFHSTPRKDKTVFLLRPYILILKVA